MGVHGACIGYRPTVSLSNSPVPEYESRIRHHLERSTLEMPTLHWGRPSASWPHWKHVQTNRMCCGDKWKNHWLVPSIVTGVRQGCLLSPSLFNLFLEFVMKDLRNLDNGIQMGEMSINNIRYADDTTLVDLVFDKLQISTNELEKACSKWGMKINPTKCKIMTADNRDITINGSPVDKVDDFVYLGSNVPLRLTLKGAQDLQLGYLAGLRELYGPTRTSQYWNKRSLKVRIYKALILPIAIYGAESWTLRQADTRQLESFEMRCLRAILGVHLMDRVKNEEIRQRLNIPNTICEEVSKRRMKLVWSCCPDATSPSPTASI